MCIVSSKVEGLTYNITNINNTLSIKLKIIQKCNINSVCLTVEGVEHFFYKLILFNTFILPAKCFLKLSKILCKNFLKIKIISLVKESVFPLPQASQTT